MRGVLYAVFCSVSAGLLCLSGGASDAAAAPLEVIPNEYIVEYRNYAPALSAAQNGWGSAADRQPGEKIGPRTFLVRNATARFGTSAAVAAVPAENADSYCRALPKSEVKSCSPNYVVRSSLSSNDPSLGELWGMSSASGVDAPRAWDLSTGSRDIVVAVLDTGVDYTHPDLAANIWTNPNEIPGNDLDDDHNGYIDDVHGISALTGSGDPMDDNGHGTHVSGIIGARGDNNVGVAGMNWQTSILGVKFLGGSGAGGIAGAIAGINYILDLKASGVDIRVVNASWGGGGFSEPLRDAIVRLRDAGIVFAAAAGNDSSDNDIYPTYPASYDVDNVISVAALTEEQNLAQFSNYGSSEVDIAAPGQFILSTVPGGYDVFSGTSMATPHVAGALALLASEAPQLAYKELIERIYLSGVALPGLASVVRTGRVLNAARALRNETGALPPPPIEFEPCDYSAAETSEGRDTSADNAPVVQRSDEYFFTQVDLPFDFPFHRESFRTVTISPNGLLYLGNAKESYDYIPGAAAPRRSIAALNADLIADAEKLGVRVSYGPDSATFRWVARLYGIPEDTVAATLTLYSDGRIRDTIETDSPVVEAVLQSNALIGLTGAKPESSVTFARGGKAIRDGLEVTFAPHCERAQSTQVTLLRLRGERNGKPVNAIVAGGRFNLDIRTNRSVGTVPLGILVNGRACAISSKTIAAASQSIHLRGSTRVLKGGRGISRIGFYSGARTADRRVDYPRSSRARTGAQRVGPRAVCRAINRSLRLVR